jgi:allantoinase
MHPLTVRSERVVLPAGERPATIHVKDGRIDSIGAYDDTAAGVPVMDADHLLVVPGLVDSHVHINEPGRTEWEGFETATRAAAAGGITTLVDMPLNSIPATTDLRGLAAKRKAAEGKLHVDVGFWGGVVPGNTGDLKPLAEAGVRGFKCFLSPSGVDEFGHVDESELRQAMPVIAETGLPLLVHAELPALLHTPDRNQDPRRYSTWLQSRPPAAEQGAIDLIIRLAKQFRTRVHIVHLASADAIASLVEAKRAGVPITVETCPHYLTFCAEEIADGATPFKCAPPIRNRDHRERLWAALLAGDIDLVATDHSPAPPALKGIAEGDFLKAWGGIASLQVSLPAVWTGAHARHASLPQLSQWMSAAPARLAGLDRMKGAIAPGLDADLVIIDPDREFTVRAASLYHRHPITPYDGRRLRGEVITTMLRGDVIFDHGESRPTPRGRTL